MTKDMMVKALSDFCASKGVETMSLPDYKSHGSDVPVKDFMLRRAWGSWARVISMMNKRYPVQVVAPKVEEVTAPKPKATKKGEK
jgi:hypothetical protein